MERTRHGSLRLQVKVDGKTNNNNKELNSQLARLKFKRGQATGGQSTKREGSRSRARDPTRPSPAPKGGHPAVRKVERGYGTAQFLTAKQFRN